MASLLYPPKACPSPLSKPHNPDSPTDVSRRSRLRRRLQRTHVVALVVHPTGNDSGAYAQANLRAFVPKLTAAQAVSQYPTTAAHLAETRTRIVRSLHAQAIV